LTRPLGADTPAPFHVGSGATLAGTFDEPAGDEPRRPESVFPVAGWDRYEFVGPLGRGGMGEVYEARDRRLGRPAALKFIRGADPDRTMRLLQEARTQARLDHPNVCKIYEVGEASGKAYIAMELVRGQRLDEAAADLPLPAKVRAMKLVAEAVHEAHRLGIVHRDLKPSNVLLERGADGGFRPVVMDFGLAYEVAQGHGLTATGALLGTPAYMAPEQARGEVRGVDQRSDVYGLGATLYELLTGAPPFRAETLAATLHRVLHDEPAPPRSLAPGLPADLETIALKCLSKEPARRYPSARALAEDLGRFLDGEPILGRRPGLGERLVRKARRNRALTALAASSLAITLSLGAFGVRSRLEAGRARAEAAERARLAEELGQQAKEIEWLLRAAYALPLHDTGPERRRVRERMAEIAARGPGGGLVHYALGRGHLALGELDPARDELERARALGLDSPELHHALGRALGELYRRALDDARRRGGRDWVERRQRALAERYLAPALAALEKGRGLKTESPRYLEGLIAFYRGDLGAAADAAERAAAETPWANEARRLGGDVAYAGAVERLERGDDEGARAGFERAIAIYEQATEVGRSDALAYEALAEAWSKRAEIEGRQGRSRKGALARALEAAGKAVRAAPDRAASHTRRAQVLMGWYQLMKYEGGGEDPGPVLDEWIETAARAVALDPRDVYAYDTAGYAYLQRGYEHAAEGKDAGPAWAEAAARLTRALELEPNYPWALNDLALVYRWTGSAGRERGEDPRPAYAEAERHFRKAIESDEKYLFARWNLVDMYNDWASYDLAHGVDPEGTLDRASEASAGALALDGRSHLALNQAAVTELTRAQRLVDRGEDPGPALARAFASLERSRSVNASFGRTSLYRAEGHRLEAAHASRSGGAPEAALGAAREALAEALRLEPGCVDCRLTGAQLDLLEASRARQTDRAALPLLRRAHAAVRAVVEAHPYAEGHQDLARACWRLAEAAPPGEAQGAIDRGLASADEALRLDPRLTHAHAIRGGLWLARSRRANDATARLDAAREAAASFARAFELDPALANEYGEAARAARP
jgi:predicted Ser/Thr protein kinase